MRALEWGAVRSLSFVGVCLAWQFTSIFSDVADVELSFGRAQMNVSAGFVVVCDHLANLEVIELVEKSAPMTPAPVNSYGTSIPGMSCRYIAYAPGNQPIWSLQVSL